MSLWKALIGALSDFRWSGCATLAASLAFFSLLSLLPLIYLILYLVGFVVSQEQIGHQFVLNFLNTMMPSLGDALGSEIERIAAERVVRWIVLGSFAWFALLVFYELDYALNVVFRSQAKRTTLGSALMCLGLLMLIEVLILASYAITQVLSLLMTRMPQGGRFSLLVEAGLGFFLVYVLPSALVVVAVTCLFRLIPRHHPSWWAALTGAVIFTALWDIAKHLFSTYIQGLTVYGRMYGSLLLVVLFLLGVYYTAALLLFSGCVVRRLDKG